MMRRANLSLVLIASALAVTLVALIYGVELPHSSATAVALKGGETKQAQPIVTIDAGPNESAVTVPPRSSDRNQDQMGVNEHQTKAVVFSRDGGIADEDPTRALVRDGAKDDIRRAYASLLEDLDLTPQEAEALFALLVEDQIARTSTPYKDAETIDQEEQSMRIAAIIGDRKLQQFRELESNIGAYWELRRIEQLLEKNDVPLTEAQRDGLLEVIRKAEESRLAAPPPPADVEPGSIEFFEHRMSQTAEYERHLMELTPSVLSSEQVVYLDKQYQYLSYSRADAIERAKQERVKGTWTEDSRLMYPAWLGD